MKLDAHQHFWRYNRLDYPWMDGDGRAVLRRDYLPSDLQPLLEQTGLAGSIAVQARQTLEETRWLLELAAEHPLIKGVVGWVDLRSPRVEDQLARFAQNPRLVGVRHVVQDEPDDRFLLGKAFAAGLGRLRRFGLTYDLLIFPRQLPAALELVEQFPEQPFVLDHIAKPCIKDGTLPPWEKHIRQLAQAPHVCCKVSGMVTEARWKGWRPEDFKPFLDVVFEAFGEDRLLFGSDWPVCLLAANYVGVVDLVNAYLNSLSSIARKKFFGVNAARFYGIE